MTISTLGPLGDALIGNAGIGWNLGRLVRAQNPGKALLDGVASPFRLLKFARAGRCEVSLAEGEHANMRTEWSRHGLQVSPVNASYDVRWSGHALRVVIAQWMEGAYEMKQVSLVVADSMDIARAFVTEASAFCNQPGENLLRFTAGCWSESHELWTAVQSASFDDLVLAGDLKSQIQRDFTSFLGAREEYERYGVPWKRGVLLVGPPGNGKTHCLRALIKSSGVPCLYVQSLKSRYGEEDSHIEAVFERAREITPCCLVFEDLDAMIHDGNRSNFLNQLDGLGSAAGLLTIATTNHADRLDPAIVERPSRFDRKYHFNLPGSAERRTYLAHWNAKMSEPMRATDEALQRVTDATEEFSFAYLKELYLSSMMRWMERREAGAMAAVLLGQVDTLREQMKTKAASPPPGDARPGADVLKAIREMF
jgi:hypothetical protein